MTGAAAPAYPGRDLEAMTFAVNYHRWIARRFEPYLRGTVAEIGAGTGEFTELLLRPGVERLIAAEPAPNLHDRLRARFADRPAVTVLNADLRSALPAIVACDALVYCNVLEHVADDAAELRLCASALRPGGALCVFVPALPMLMSDFDRSIGHYRRYLPGRLREGARGAGLFVEDLRWFDSLGVLPWLVVMKLLGRAADPGAVRAYDRWVVPWLMPIEWRLAPPLGKNLVMVARRPPA